MLSHDNVCKLLGISHKMVVNDTAHNIIIHNCVSEACECDVREWSE